MEMIYDDIHPILINNYIFLIFYGVIIDLNNI